MRARSLGRQDTDYAVGFAVQLQSCAHCGRIRPEMLPAEGITDNNLIAWAEGILLVWKVAVQHWPHGHHGKAIDENSDAVEFFRLPRAFSLAESQFCPRLSRNSCGAQLQSRNDRIVAINSGDPSTLTRATLPSVSA
jgi:hypothetical protein